MCNLGLKTLRLTSPSYIVDSSLLKTDFNGLLADAFSSAPESSVSSLNTFPGIKRSFKSLRSHAEHGNETAKYGNNIKVRPRPVRPTFLFPLSLCVPGSLA
jgi:hypothetical protein